MQVYTKCNWKYYNISLKYNPIFLTLLKIIPVNITRLFSKYRDTLEYYIYNTAK